MFSHVRRFWKGYLLCLLAVVLTSGCYFAFSGTHEGQYEGSIGEPDSLEALDQEQDLPDPVLPESLEDDFDLIDDPDGPRWEDSTGTVNPDTLPSP